jgi:hypothetical protein
MKQKMMREFLNVMLTLQQCRRRFSKYSQLSTPGLLNATTFEHPFYNSNNRSRLLPIIRILVEFEISLVF